MDVDDFVTTDRGLTLRGASPDMLDELLAQYSALQRAEGYDLDELLRPGRSRDEIVTAWAERGVTVPEEAVRLWMWHDGSPLGPYPGAVQDSLHESLWFYDDVRPALTDFAWHPAWIPVWGSHNIAMSTDTPVPIIRGEDGVHEWDGWDERVQAISFCTVIGMAIYGREQGLYTRNEIGIPTASLATWPEAMRITRLYSF